MNEIVHGLGIAHNFYVAGRYCTQAKMMFVVLLWVKGELGIACHLAGKMGFQ